MRKIAVLLHVFAGLYLPAASQPRMQLGIDIGPTFTSQIRYQNCTGHIDPAITASFAFLYRANSFFELELKFSNLIHPTSYLNNDSDNTVKIYTTSHIVLQHLLTGFNFFVPSKHIHPYIGLLLGASYAQTKEIAPESHIFSFTWGFQTGVTLNLSGLIALKLGGYVLLTPGVYNNTSYFNVAADGSGFPSFAIGDPSKATITQWSMNIGIVVNFGKK
jgi:hypothetical protein